MQKYLVGAAALLAATAANASVAINFNSATGNLGNSHTYTSGSLSVTATGYSAASTQTALFGKNGGGDENGLGLAADPSGQNEIYYPGGDFVQLDVHNLFGLVTSATFFMGSTTSGEGWAVYGSNIAGQLGSLLLPGSDELSHSLSSWGTYTYYDFVATGTLNGEQRTTGNVLLGGLSLTQAVPEPATWAMMLVGFAGIGAVARRRRAKPIAQIA